MALKDLNNNNLVFKLQYGEFSMLFTGDIEAKTENDLVSRYGKTAEHCFEGSTSRKQYVSTYNF